mmetsp:Transcript_23144/g.68293  ORF Transcript_23144/g.68293 Transcript_23144/m.68293 type:complete len:346 (+) Transcript_23144:3133-4170(+)
MMMLLSSFLSTVRALDRSSQPATASSCFWIPFLGKRASWDEAGKKLQDFFRELMHEPGSLGKSVQFSFFRNSDEDLISFVLAFGLDDTSGCSDSVSSGMALESSGSWFRSRLTDSNALLDEVAFRDDDMRSGDGFPCVLLDVSGESVDWDALFALECRRDDDFPGLLLPEKFSLSSWGTELVWNLLMMGPMARCCAGRSFFAPCRILSLLIASCSVHAFSNASAAALVSDFLDVRHATIAAANCASSARDLDDDMVPISGRNCALLVRRSNTSGKPTALKSESFSSVTNDDTYDSSDSVFGLPPSMADNDVPSLRDERAASLIIFLLSLIQHPNSAGNAIFPSLA